jgi:hypothetical protein
MIARSLLLGLAAVSLTATAPAFAAGKPRNVSWGQIGVSFAAYNRDAQQCTAGTQGVTLSLSPQTAHDLAVFGNGSLMGLFGIEGISPATALSPSHVRFYSSTYAETYKHALRMDFTDQLQAILDQCLTERGYRPFRLTKAQMNRLHDLARGSAERARYLYSLGSDPAVLISQAL